MAGRQSQRAVAGRQRAMAGRQKAMAGRQRAMAGCQRAMAGRQRVKKQNFLQIGKNVSPWSAFSAVPPLPDRLSRSIL